MCLCCCVCERGGCNYILVSFCLLLLLLFANYYVEYVGFLSFCFFSLSLIHRRLPIVQVFEMLLMPWRKNYVYVCPILFCFHFLFTSYVKWCELVKVLLFPIYLSFDLILLLIFYHFLFKFYFSLLYHYYSYTIIIDYLNFSIILLFVVVKEKKIKEIFWWWSTTHATNVWCDCQSARNDVSDLTFIVFSFFLFPLHVSSNINTFYKP